MMMMMIQREMRARRKRRKYACLIFHRDFMLALSLSRSHSLFFLSFCAVEIFFCAFMCQFWVSQSSHSRCRFFLYSYSELILRKKKNISWVVKDGSFIQHIMQATSVDYYNFLTKWHNCGKVNLEIIVVLRVRV